MSLGVFGRMYASALGVWQCGHTHGLFLQRLHCRTNLSQVRQYTLHSHQVQLRSWHTLQSNSLPSCSRSCLRLSPGFAELQTSGEARAQINAHNPGSCVSYRRSKLHTANQWLCNAGLLRTVMPMGCDVNDWIDQSAQRMACVFSTYRVAPRAARVCRCWWARVRFLR